MPVGYSEDVKLPAFLKSAKNKLDICTYKLNKIKKEFEEAEAEYNELKGQHDNRLANSKLEEKPEKRRPSRRED
ncbi:MAG: hypothetical protein ACXADF_17130 [Candidatus Thorarchaeota archaeon]|jgi:hypothetical protein